jgi:hypothetical protein
MIYLVAGLGRCGTTMAMRMLHAGGMIPAVDNEVAYEHNDMNDAIRDIDSLDGKLVKWLDPHKNRLPHSHDYKIIWMKRDFNQQAKSIAKFANIMAGVPKDRASVRSIYRSLPKETDACLRIFKERGIPYIVVAFEDLLILPRQTAITIEKFFNHKLDINRMASCVIPRSKDCTPDLAIENQFGQKYGNPG